MITRIFFTASILSSLGTGLFAAGPECSPLNAEKKAALSRYVERKYRLPENAQLNVSAVADLEGTCYRKIRFEAGASSVHFDKTFYLTPDQRFLVPELNDSTLDPIAEERRQMAMRRQELETGAAGMRRLAYRSLAGRGTGKLCESSVGSQAQRLAELCNSFSPVFYWRRSDLMPRS